MINALPEILIKHCIHCFIMQYLNGILVLLFYLINHLYCINLTTAIYTLNKAQSAIIITLIPDYQLLAVSTC